MSSGDDPATRLVKASSSGNLLVVQEILGVEGDEDRLSIRLDGLSRQLIHHAAKAGQHAL